MQKKGSQEPFFIIGSGRSGTTLLRNLLNQNPNIIIPPESGDSYPESFEFYVKNCRKYERQELIEETYNFYVKNPNWKYWGLDIQDVLKAAKSKDVVVYGDLISNLYESFRNKYKPGATLWADKNPYMTFYMPYIKKTFPKSKFIHLIRDGRDVVLSWKDNNLKYSNLEDIIDRWNLSLEMVERFEPKSSLLEIRYEDLVTNTKVIIEQIYSFLEIPNSNTSFSGKKILDYGNELMQKHHIRSKHKIDKTSIGKWKSGFSDSELEIVIKGTRNKLRKYGYSVE